MRNPCLRLALALPVTALATGTIPTSASVPSHVGDSTPSFAQGVALGTTEADLTKHCATKGWKCSMFAGKGRAGRTGIHRTLAFLPTPAADGTTGIVFVIKDGILVGYKTAIARKMAPSFIKSRRTALDAAFGAGTNEEGAVRWVSKDQSTLYRLSLRRGTLEVLSLTHSIAKGLLTNNEKSKVLAGRMPRTAKSQDHTPMKMLPMRLAAISKPAGCTSPALKLEKLPKAVFTEEGTPGALAFTAKNFTSCEGVSVQLELKSQTQSFGSVTVPPLAAGASSMIVLPIVKGPPLGMHPAELSASDPGTFGGKKFPIFVNVAPAGGYRGPLLAVTRLSVPTAPTGASGVSVKVEVTNLGKGNCAASPKDCQSTDPFKLSIALVNGFGVGPTASVVELDSTGTLKVGETKPFVAELKLPTAINEYQVVRAMLVEGTNVSPKHAQMSQQLIVTDEGANKLVNSLDVYKVEWSFGNITCNSENDLTSIVYGDQPYAIATQFVNAKKGQCGEGNDICPNVLVDPARQKFSNVPLGKFALEEGDSRALNLQGLIADRVMAGGLTGFHISLWEFDLFNSVDDDDEIDWAYMAMDYDTLTQYVGKGPINKKLTFAGDGGEYDVEYAFTVTKDGKASTDGVFPSVNYHRYEGTYDMIIDGHESIVQLKYQPASSGAQRGSFSGSWKGGSRVESLWTPTPGGLSGSLFEFYVTGLDANKANQRFVGHLIGPPGEEAIAGTTWFEGLSYGFYMTRRP